MIDGLLLVLQLSKHDNLSAVMQGEGAESVISLQVHERNGEEVLAGIANVENPLDFDEVQREAFTLINQIN